jgi:hypothetical protein
LKPLWKIERWKIERWNIERWKIEQRKLSEENIETGSGSGPYSCAYGIGLHL